MPDIGQFLLGAWRLTRLGWDGVTARSMRLRGTARVSNCAAGLLLEERGILTVGAHVGEATRRTLFHIVGDSVATACFEDGRPFHRLDLATGMAPVRHDCPPDRYEGRYRVLTPACWLLSWRVTGPRKNQVITSRFTRPADAGWLPRR